MFDFPDDRTPENQAAEDWRSIGESDAGRGYSPQYPDNDAYLDGYFAEVKRRIQSGQYCLEIRWLSKAFVTGSYDMPSWMTRSEEF